jgi:hypothetical protein
MADSSSKANSRLTKISDFLTGSKTATAIPWDPDCTKFPNRNEVPRREDAPAGAAWVWGQDDYVCYSPNKRSSVNSVKVRHS